MIKKALVLIVPLLAVTALALIPISASADVECPPGVQNKSYCKHVCKVPNVVGRSLHRAKEVIRKHDCDVGEISRQELDNPSQVGPGAAIEKRSEKGMVVKQRPRPGGVYRAHHEVNLVVEF